MSTTYVSIEIRTTSPEASERAAAEAWDAGAAGLEDRGRVLVIYADSGAAGAIAAALRACPGVDAVGLAVAVPDTDWSQVWKVGLEPIRISSRLCVSHEPGEGVDLVIAPAMAFGTGGHASTRLALEWIDALGGELEGPVLDVGVGSGVLALAALVLGARRAVGCDVDPLATRAALGNAVANGFAGRLACWTGSLDALGACAFPLVVANLLRTELLPLADAITAHTAPGGHVVLSGLLSTELAAVEAAFPAFERAGERCRDEWSALLMRRR